MLPALKLRSLVLQMLALVLAGTLLGFAVNALNPRGINLRIAWGFYEEGPKP